MRAWHGDSAAPRPVIRTCHEPGTYGRRCRARRWTVLGGYLELWDALEGAEPARPALSPGVSGFEPVLKSSW